MLCVRLVISFAPKTAMLADAAVAGSAADAIETAGIIDVDMASAAITDTIFPGNFLMASPPRFLIFDAHMLGRIKRKRDIDFIDVIV